MVYFLDAAPTLDDDDAGEFFADKRHRVFLKHFDHSFLNRDVRMGGMLHCGTKSGPVDQIPLECCRGRVVADIEKTKPVIVVGVGNEALKWATGLSGGVGLFSGRLIATKIGNHSCWYVAVPDSEWIAKQKGNYGKSPHELVYEADLKWVQKLIRDGLNNPDLPSAPYDEGIEYITGQSSGDIERLEAALERMKAYPAVSIDYETNALRPQRVKDPKIYLCAIGTADDVVVFTLDHPEGWMTPQKRRQAWSLLGDFLLNSGIKVAHNLHMEHTWTNYFFGPEILRLTHWDDTMAQAHTLDERKGALSLDALTRIHFGFFLKAQSRVDPVRLLEYPLLEAMRYNGLDSKWDFALWERQCELLSQEKAYQRESDRKVRLCPTLVLTEAKGLPVDMDYAIEQGTRLKSESSTLEARIQRMPEVVKYTSKFGRFSPSAPDDVLRLMRDICKRSEVSVQDRDGSTKETTDESALSKIPKEEVPSAHMILELRQIDKLLSTYIDPLLEGKTVCHDGMVHSTYNSMVAVTGRLSAEDPNVQNFPKRKFSEIRGVIYAWPDHTFLACDYGQIEARVIGMASEDVNLVKYLWTGYDIHGYWADRVLKEYPGYSDYLIREFSLNGDDVKAIRKTARQEAKNKWVFPQFFGSSHKSCARDLNIPVNIAEDLAKEFWDEFKGVKRWQDKLIQNYERKLYVETLTGRRRRRAMTKNELINMPIQGTAADIVTAAMNALSERSVMEGDEDLHPNLNVHDDLSFIIPNENLPKVLPIIAEEMCRHRFDFINVPLLVEASSGQRWNGLKEIAVYRSDDIFNLRNPYK